MKQIKLSRGLVAKIDDIDYPMLSKYKWHANPDLSGGFAARRFVYKNGKKTRGIYMHRQIMGQVKNRKIDHINGDRLDNRRCNLRIATARENIRNQKTRVNNTSGYKGVSWHKRAKKWYAYISNGIQVVQLGYFDTKESAANAYNAAAIKYHKKFARLNKVNQ